MVAEVIDYRVSRLVVLCKDCGQDVGMYPARHKCGADPNAPAVPPIPSNVPSSTSSSGSNGWAKLKAAKDHGKLSADNRGNAVNTHSRNNSGSGDDSNGNHNEGLWKKLRAVRNWKDVNEGAAPTTQASQGSKLWDKLLSATSTLKENIYTAADSDNESEKDDWEGETHISRVLREYHEKKSNELPTWLYDDQRRKKRSDMIPSTLSNGKNSSNSNISQQNSEEETYTKTSFRDIYDSALPEGNNTNVKEIGSLSNRKPRLWESDVGSPKKQSSKDNQLSAPNNHRFEVQEGGNASSLPKDYETRNYIGRSKTTTGNKYKNDLQQSSKENQFRVSVNHRREGENASLPKNYESRRANVSNNSTYKDDSQNRYYDAPPIPTSSPSARNVTQKDSYLQYRSGQYYNNDTIHRTRSINPNPSSHAYASSPRGRNISSNNRQGGYF